MSDPGNDVPLRSAGRGRVGAEEAVRHHRAPLPVDRSILWTPNRDPDVPSGPSETGPYELFLTRSALRQMDAHLTAGGKESRFGFFLGNLFRCPESGVHYAVADRCLPVAESFSEETPDPFLLRAWAKSQATFREHGGVLIGWYHSHYLLGLFLSEEDAEVDSRYFSQPWQCCVLVVPDEARPLGAVFRPSAEDGNTRSEPAPFRELIAPTHVPASGGLPTAIGWTNYRPDRQVALRPDLPDNGERSEKPAVVRVPQAAPSSASANLVLPDNRFERIYPRFPGGRRRLILVLAAVAVVLGFLGGLRLFESAPQPVAPTSTPPDQPRVSPEVQRFTAASTVLQEAMLAYDERQQDFDLGRIGCELLAGGYSAADDAFISMAGSYAGIGMGPGTADESVTTEYERLVSEMNRINEHFDASGCPRPQ